MKIQTNKENPRFQIDLKVWIKRNNHKMVEEFKKSKIEEFEETRIKKVFRKKMDGFPFNLTRKIWKTKNKKLP